MAVLCISEKVDLVQSLENCTRQLNSSGETIITKNPPNKWQNLIGLATDLNFICADHCPANWRNSWYHEKWFSRLAPDMTLAKPLWKGWHHKIKMFLFSGLSNLNPQCSASYIRPGWASILIIFLTSFSSASLTARQSLSLTLQLGILKRYLRTVCQGG